MSWFETGGFTNIARTAISSAQKAVDAALDIKDEADDVDGSPRPSETEQFTQLQTTADTPRRNEATTLSKKPASRTGSSLDVTTAASPKVTSEDGESFWSTFFTGSPSANQSSSTRKSKPTMTAQPDQSPRQKERSPPKMGMAIRGATPESSPATPKTSPSPPAKITPSPLAVQKDTTPPRRLADTVEDTGRLSEASQSGGKEKDGGREEVKQTLVEEASATPFTQSATEKSGHVSGKPEELAVEGRERETTEECDPEVKNLVDVGKNEDSMVLNQESMEVVELDQRSSDQGSQGSDQGSLRSDSDFVVISDIPTNGSEHLSLRGVSPENVSPKHSNNGKSSPSESDYSIISEDKVLETLGHDLAGLGHRRTDSDASTPSEAKGQTSEQEGQLQLRLSGSETDTTEEGEVGHSETVPLAQKEGGGNDSNDDSGGGNPLEAEKLLKKLAELAQVLQARESQILTLSKENVDLQESNNILKNQLGQLEEVRASETTDLNALMEEFTTRISDMEKKLQQSQKERDRLVKELQASKIQLAESLDVSQTTELIQEKDNQIQGLMAEGEKLSKQQLQNSNIIKKLRIKEKEDGSLIKTLKQQLEESQSEVKHLQEVLDGKIEIEKKQKETITKLNTVFEKQEKELVATKSELEDCQGRIQSVQAALDNSYKEIGELHKTIASKESKVAENQLSVEMSAKEELRLALERARQEARFEQERLALQVSELRMNLERADTQSGRREDNLRQEISDLHQRLQGEEGRNQELSQSVTAATRPLLRQIENLQASLSTQSSSSELVERNLTERLLEAQSNLAAATEKERTATESSLESNSRISSLESKLALLRQEKSKFSAQLEIEKAKVCNLEDARNIESAQLESTKQTYSKALEEAQKEKAQLEKQLEVEKMRVEVERKKAQAVQESLREKELRLLETSRAMTHTPSVHSRSSSFGSEKGMSLTQSDSEPSLASPLSLYDSMRNSSSSAGLIESLQSQVKQREGEIAQLQEDIADLERTRAAMGEELVNLTNKNEVLEEQVGEIPQLKNQLTDLDQRYNAILQMYGEKAEETEELRMDLQDVKDMYKQQIEDLLTTTRRMH